MPLSYPWQYGLAMALSGTIGYFAAEARLSAESLVFARCVIAALFLGVYGALTRQRSSFFACKKKLGWVLVSGVALALNWLALFKAFQLTSITVAVSLYYTAPLLVVLAGVLFYGDRATPRRLFAVGLGFVGCLAVTGLGMAGPTSVDLAGIGYALLAAVFYAAVILAGKNITGITPVTSALVQTLCGSVLLVAFVDFPALAAPEIRWTHVLTLGVVHTGLLYVLFFRSVRHLPAQTIGVLGFIDPAVAIVVDRLAYGNPLAGVQVLGVLAIFFAIAQITLGDRRLGRQEHHVRGQLAAN